jgi:hypothetical protein
VVGPLGVCPGGGRMKLMHEQQRMEHQVKQVKHLLRTKAVGNPGLLGYLETTYCPALDTYSSSERWNSALYALCRYISIPLSGLTTVLITAGFANNAANLRLLTIVVSALVGIIASLLTTFDYHGKWLAYRAVTHELVTEAVLFCGDYGHYQGVATAKDNLFVTEIDKALRRAEMLWGKEHQEPQGPTEPMSAPLPARSPAAH